MQSQPMVSHFYNACLLREAYMKWKLSCLLFILKSLRLDFRSRIFVKSMSPSTIFRVGPDIRFGRFSGRIPDIKTIRLQDIRQIFYSGYPAGYPVICRISNVGQISGRNRISGIINQPDIRYPAKKVCCPTLIETTTKVKF